MGAASLTIAHTVKAESRESERYPFGTHFWHLGARQTWFVQSDDPEESSETLHLGLFNRKANERVRRRPFGLKIEFSNGATALSLESIENRFEEKLGLKSRIRHLLLREGKMSRAALCAALDVGDEAVRKALQRMSDARNEGRSPHSQWWLADDSTSDA